ARYYDSATGRFIGHDPFAGMESDPASLHRYLYAKDDPVDFIDPSGELTTVEILATAAIGATIAIVGISSAILNELNSAAFYDDKQKQQITTTFAMTEEELECGENEVGGQQQCNYSVFVPGYSTRETTFHIMAALNGGKPNLLHYKLPGWPRPSSWN